MIKPLKKSLFLTCCLATTFAASAQMDVVKNAEKAMKANKPYVEVYEMILPAMSNPETANEAATYFIPGKAGFAQFDNLLMPRQLGRLAEGDEQVMAKALIGGYENFIKALPLDTVVDAKGKVKTKYSKDIHNIIGGHYADFTQAGVDLYNAKDYPNAYKAWSIFVDLSGNPEKFKIQNLQTDSVVAQYAYYAGLSAYEMDKKDDAALMFKKATELNPDYKDAWKNGMISSLNINDPKLLMYFAEGGDQRFGKEDPDFTGTIINYYLSTKDYKSAVNYLDRAIANDPSNSQYYVLKGVLNEEMNDMPGAKQLYEKAISIDPQNGLANFQLGRSIYIEAENLDNNADQNSYARFKENTLNPLYREAVHYLEEAYKFDQNNKSKALTLLSQLYYQLNDEAGMKSVEDRKLNDD